MRMYVCTTLPIFLSICLSLYLTLFYAVLRSAYLSVPRSWLQSSSKFPRTLPIVTCIAVSGNLTEDDTSGKRRTFEPCRHHYSQGSPRYAEPSDFSTLCCYCEALPFRTFTPNRRGLECVESTHSDATDWLTFDH